MKDLEIKTYIFSEIFILSNKLQLLGDKVDSKLTVKQWFFIAGVMSFENKMPTLSDISIRLGTSRQNIKKIAVILEKKNLITIEKSLNDARILHVKLTDFCKKHLKNREKIELDFIEKLFNDISFKDLTVFSNVIKKIEKNVDIMGDKYEKKEI